ncbi:5-formyltetrahydrofolate cyclo-ligase [Sporobolomyces salmoneus]|uniref:5-formyltetrahydrofolate cyclo-ligase n=1 Tax=Sporobolomyces salmoneus TaxID=183962 RepID=UPI003171F269
MTATLTSSATVQKAKTVLRRQITARLKAIPPSVLARTAQTIIDHLIQSPYYVSAKNISCYLSLPVGEVQTDQIIRHALANDKRVFVPYCPIEDKTTMKMLRLKGVDHFEGLKENRWGIRELDPKEVDSLEDAEDAISGGLDLILVPGLAFDTKRRRLGHGRGYYDRYITNCLDYPARFEKPPPRTVALALQEQMVKEGEEIPTNEWDRLPDMLLTPKGEVL